MPGIYSHFAHIAAWYRIKGDLWRADHYAKLAQGRLSFLSLRAKE